MFLKRRKILQNSNLSNPLKMLKAHFLVTLQALNLQLLLPKNKIHYKYFSVTYMYLLRTAASKKTSKKSVAILKYIV